MATFSLVCARMICRCVTVVGAIFKIYISQGTAMRLRCGGSLMLVLLQMS